MEYPPSLRAHDKVAIVATARKISTEEIQPAIEMMEGWGLEVIVGKSVNAEYFQFAGDDELRINDFQEMLDDETIKAILFARGGYGTVRLIDEIDWRNFLKHPKWLCGFSDITVIHSHLSALYNFASIHSLMALNFETASEGSIESLKEVLFGEKIHYTIEGNDLNRRGEANGILCGGNLSVLYSLNGTASDISTEGKILFIEDIDEHLYHVDRMMVNLKRSGKLEHLSALIAGTFTGMKNKDENNRFGKSAYEIIAEHTEEFDYPVCFGFPAGHEADNRTLVMGAGWELKISESVKLIQV
ncbi:MAG: LD-carboxypeptidase [Chitinophagales bacterium]|nr:LD-carboxypeptidase [Chitinophagales bacterium]